VECERHATQEEDSEDRGDEMNDEPGGRGKTDRGHRAGALEAFPLQVEDVGCRRTQSGGHDSVGGRGGQLNGKGAPKPQVAT
jgi:hypothetical protein